MKGIGKRYCYGSGWVEVALEAKLITSGSPTGVIDGKNWDRALNTQKSMLEALERILYRKFCSLNENLDLSTESHNILQNIGDKLSQSTVNQIL